MPRNAVYGKHGNSAGFFAMTTFLDSSSSAEIEKLESSGRQHSNEVRSKKIKETEVEVFADRFRELEIASDKYHNASQENELELENIVLSERDSNNSVANRKNSKQREYSTRKLETFLEEHLSAAKDDRVRRRRLIRGIQDAPERRRSRSQASSLSDVLPNLEYPDATSKAEPEEPLHVESKTLRRSSSLSELRTHQKALASKQDAQSETIISHLRPLFSLASETTGVPSATSYQEWAEALSLYFNISKIAEASYGEVYRLSLNAKNSELTSSDESVLKIIPLKPAGCPSLNTDHAHFSSEVADVANEVRLLRRMTDIPGFTNFREIRVMQGRPPPQFVAAWKAWNKKQPRGKKSLFPDPSRKKSYPMDQLWAVIEMQDAGFDLETQPCTDVWAAWDVFWGTAIALAKGEEEARFEHRDLHLGNICVKSTRKDESNGPVLKPEMKLGYTGLETTIIDYTISRANMNESQQVNQTDDDLDDVAYFDLSKDPAIFEGDSTKEYQYDIYRYMRAAFLFDDPIAETTTPELNLSRIRGEVKNWKQYSPITNMVWLHFLLYQIIEQIEAWPSCEAEPEDNGSWEVALRIEQMLLEMQKLLELEGMRDSVLRSAKDLVEWAVEQNWLDVADVIGLATPIKRPKTKDTKRRRKGVKQSLRYP